MTENVFYEAKVRRAGAGLGFTIDFDLVQQCELEKGHVLIVDFYRRDRPTVVLTFTADAKQLCNNRSFGIYLPKVIKDTLCLERGMHIRYRIIKIYRNFDMCREVDGPEEKIK